jgi:hypothetical protein
MVEYQNRGTITEGDYGKYIYIELYDEDDNLYDYSGYSSIVLYLKKYGATTCKVEGVCESIGTGTVRYQLQEGDTDTPGDYIGELKIYSPGAITTWRNIYLKIAEKVAD